MATEGSGFSVHRRGASTARVLQFALVAFAILDPAAEAVGNELSSWFVFPPEALHNHGSSLVEAPSGMLLVAWFRGSGERTADDVAIWGATKQPSASWSAPFVLADTPGFPDTNCTLLVDDEGSLWLFWPTIQANTWESALMKYKVARREDWDGLAEPRWSQEKVLHMKPGDDFAERVAAGSDEYLRSLGISLEEMPTRIVEWRERNVQMAADKLTRRLGWFTRPHPIQLRHGPHRGRILVGLYSDGFSFSMATWTDDRGANWQMSEPIVGGGNVQPSLVELESGEIIAFMRDNGPVPKKVLVSRSRDGGATWTVVSDHPDLVDSGAGVDALRLRDGRILVVHNDVPDGRHQLAVSVSSDDGATFQTVRYLEQVLEGEGRFHYPSAIQTRDGRLHVTYSHHLPPEKPGGAERKSIRHAWFGEEWLVDHP